MKTPIEQLENALAEVATLRESVTILTTRAESAEALAGEAVTIKAEVERISAELASRDNALASANERLAAVSAERDAALAEAKRIKDERALTPAAYEHVSDGTTPISNGAPDDRSVTWPEAVKRCNGNYATAREKYSSAYREFMRQNENYHKP